MENWKRKTAIFLSSQGISLLGSSLVQYAIMWHITLFTQSGAMMTISIICGFLPHFIMAPFAGVWADRFDRKKLIILSDGFIAAATLCAAVVFLMGLGELWMLFAVSSLRALGGAVQTPAVNALLPQIVPQEKLTRVGGLNSSMQSSIMIVSPMLGALLLSLAPIELIFFVDVVTAAAAILILSFLLHVPAHEKAKEAQPVGYFKDMLLGLKYIRSHGYVKRFFMFCAVFYIIVTPTAFLTPLQVARSFDGGEWHLAAIEIAFSVGMIVGGLLIASWGGFKNRVHTMVAASLIFGACAFAIGVVPVFSLYLVFMAIMGLGMPAFNTPSTVLLQEKVEGEYLGRVFGIFGMIATSLMPLSMLIYGPIADVVPIETLLIITGPLMVLLGLLMLRNRALVKAGEPLPKEPAEAVAQ
jgi:DHA3 family macrolide efflux protein-like MFS transporter